MAAGNQQPTIPVRTLGGQGIAVPAGRRNAVLIHSHPPGTSRDSNQRPGGLQSSR